MKDLINPLLFACLILFISFLVVFVILKIVELFFSIRNSKESSRCFLVEYICKTHNLDTGETAEKNQTEEVFVKTPEEAIQKVSQALNLQKDREVLDLGISLREYSDFRAKKI